MAGFSELIKNFEKTRDYVRDFFIYGYKVRNDSTRKAPVLMMTKSAESKAGWAIIWYMMTRSGASRSLSRWTRIR